MFDESSEGAAFVDEPPDAESGAEPGAESEVGAEFNAVDPAAEQEFRGDPPSGSTNDSVIDTTAAAGSLRGSQASAPLEDTLCFCFHISRRKIVNYVRRERPRRASLISQCFGAGSGCGWCIPFLIQLHQEIMGDQVIHSESIDAAQYEAMRRSYLADVREGKRERNRIGESTDSNDSNPSEDEEYLL